MFSYKFCDIFESIYFYRTFPVAAFVDIMKLKESKESAVIKMTSLNPESSLSKNYM